MDNISQKIGKSVQKQCGGINSATDQRTNICFFVLKFLPEKMDFCSRTVYLDPFLHPHMTYRVS